MKYRTTSRTRVQHWTGSPRRTLQLPLALKQGYCIHTGQTSMLSFVLDFSHLAVKIFLVLANAISNFSNRRMRIFVCFFPDPKGVSFIWVMLVSIPTSSKRLAIQSTFIRPPKTAPSLYYKTRSYKLLHEDAVTCASFYLACIYTSERRSLSKFPVKTNKSGKLKHSYVPILNYSFNLKSQHLLMVLITQKLTFDLRV